MSACAITSPSECPASPRGSAEAHAAEDERHARPPARARRSPCRRGSQLNERLRHLVERLDRARLRRVSRTRPRARGGCAPRSSRPLAPGARRCRRGRRRTRSRSAGRRLRRRARRTRARASRRPRRAESRQIDGNRRRRNVLGRGRLVRRPRRRRSRPRGGARGSALRRDRDPTGCHSTAREQLDAESARTPRGGALAALDRRRRARISVKRGTPAASADALPLPASRRRGSRRRRNTTAGHSHEAIFARSSVLAVVTFRSRGSPSTTLIRPPRPRRAQAQSVALAARAARRKHVGEKRLRRLRGDEPFPRRSSRRPRRRERA